MTVAPEVGAARPGRATQRSRAATVSALSQLIGKGLHLALNVVSTLAILRYLAPTAYGSYVLVITVTTLAGVIADFGLPKLALRELARAGAAADHDHDPDHVDGDREENEIIGTVVMIRLGLAVVAFAACQGFLVLLQQPVVVHQAAAISSLVLIMDAVLGVVVVSFQVRMVQQYEAGVRVAAETLETALVLILISLQVGLLWLFLPPVVGLALGTLLACGLARSRFRLRLRPNRHRLRDLIIEALPVGPALLIGVLFLKLDSLVLAKLRPAHDLGIYGAAYQPIEYLFLATAVIINVLFPMIAREWAATDPARFIELYRRGTELLVIVTAFVPLVFVFVAPNVVRLAFGPAYAQSSAPLRILAFALVALTVSGWQSLVLLAGGLQRITLICNASALAVALVVCVALVSRFGVNGAALSALISGSLVMVASNAIIRVRLGATLELAPLIRILVALAATGAVLFGLSKAGVPWLGICPAAVLVYGIVLQRFRFHRSILAAIG